ncbi:MAG: hypothetical protein AAF429_03940 [Pseudomonadota bacterium]
MEYDREFFKSCLGKKFSIEFHEEFGHLELVEVSDLNASLPNIDAFSLVFISKNTAVLGQQTYTLKGPNYKNDLFLVPVGRDEQGTRYEAVFN